MLRNTRDAGELVKRPHNILLIASASFAVSSLILLSGPLPFAIKGHPWLESFEQGRVAMGIVYLGVAGGIFLARISVPLWRYLASKIIAWGERHDWSRKEVRRLVDQLAEMT